MRATARALVAALAALGAPAWAGCATGTFQNVPYTACSVDPRREDLRLFHAGPDGELLGSFERVNAMLAAEGKTLGFAMNGGMYHGNRAPVGLYVEAGRETASLVTTDGPGNFGLLPNGVFCLGPVGARVMETAAFARAGPTCTYASQSGPMLVIDGTLHPRFLPRSESRFVRNGVGVRPDGTVVLAITEAPVNFHTFARLFRDGLGTPDALYIDGKVSRLYDAATGRSDFGFPLGPMIGTAVPLD